MNGLTMAAISLSIASKRRALSQPRLSRGLSTWSTILFGGGSFGDNNLVHPPDLSSGKSAAYDTVSAIIFLDDERQTGGATGIVPGDDFVSSVWPLPRHQVRNFDCNLGKFDGHFAIFWHV